MKFFYNQVLMLSDAECGLLGQIIVEARRCIATPLEDPHTLKMEKRADGMFGAQQLIRLYLEQLQTLFREQNGTGVMQFFLRMKIEYAKQLIRENQMNFTQISDFLGYSSVHYFSGQFKEIAKMAPSEYASSVKAFSESRTS